ncbi:hypothetical protein [uncultured Lamprocystis sp.]|jgi:hypothetical protein|nr:hypothetical protein [uncultured Lamprocystis sp.]
MVANVLIAGAGQLGSRNLQGLSRYSKPLSIWVYDVSEESLTRAGERWAECAVRPHAVTYITDLKLIPATLDAAIVATNANVRLQVVESIGRLAKVRYWLLEKVLAQEVGDLYAIARATAEANGAWVNTPMHLWPLYQEVLNRFRRGAPIHASSVRFRGLACNAIHYIDLVSRWNNASIRSINTDGLRNQWVPSKRPGFYEAEGRLIVSFSDGSTLLLEGDEQANDYSVSLQGDDDVWVIDEAGANASSAGGQKIEAGILRQSDLIGPMLDELFKTGTCGLPTLTDSIAQHVPLLTALLQHWNANMPGRLDYAPIT